MTCPPTTNAILDQHTALASRLIHSGSIPLPFFQWLARASTRTSPVRPPTKQIGESIETLLAPLRIEANEKTRQATDSASQWIASICEFIGGYQRRDVQHCQFHLVAAGLLPLYWTLATGRLQEGFHHCRRRLSESLILLGLIEDLDLENLLQVSVTPQHSPHRVLRDQIQIDLTRLDSLIASTLSAAEGIRDVGEQEPAILSPEISKEVRPPQDIPIPEWASPQTLWVIANELEPCKTDLIVPRSWIDTPIPWSKVGEHWFALKELLAHCSREVCVRSSAERKNHPARSRCVHTPSQDKANGENVAAEQASATRSIPKILIGEISCLEDTAFINVIKRQVAVCRTEMRSICLSMVVVSPDCEGENQSFLYELESGLKRWQKKLVTWLAEHPSLFHPVAFVTREGQLIMAVPDSERNEMTAILRQGLIETLTGSTDISFGNLSQVHVPARFHVGIASTTTPRASFSPQELIDSAHRCLRVAQSLGKASIKSIEVF